MPIPQFFLDELILRCPVEEVVADYVLLTPKGGNLWGLCPFHSEKTPSFSVSPDKHIFHCFGCGKGGGVIRFVMEMENLSFREAVEKLAARAGLELPEEDAEAQRRRNHQKRLLELNRQAALFYHQTLKSPLGAPMLRYATQVRRLTPAYIKHFGLGAAPDGWDYLLNAMTARGYEKGELLEAGLAVTGKNGGVYDKFRNRLMLPVLSPAGEVLGFTSRVMDDSTPKYLNTPETPLFKKRSILYGINHAKKTKRNFFLLVEGNLDVITLHQAGFDNAVATMGTALTLDHARLVSKYTKELVLCYDNDDAGTEATQRAMAVLKDSELTVRVLRLPRRQTPEGELVKQDPDDFIKYQGAAAFETLLAGSENQSAYKLATIAQKHDLNTDQGRADFLREAAKTVAALSSPVEREIYATRAAQMAGVSKDAMAREVEETRKRGARQAKRKEERSALTPAVALQPKSRELRYQDIRSARAEEGLIRLILLDPTLLRQPPPLEESDFSVPLWGRLWRLILERVEAGSSVNAAAFEEELSGEEAGLLAQILQQPTSLADGYQALSDYIAVIRSHSARRQEESADPLEGLLKVQARRKKN